MPKKVGEVVSYRGEKYEICRYDHSCATPCALCDLRRECSDSRNSSDSCNIGCRRGTKFQRGRCSDLIGVNCYLRKVPGKSPKIEPLPPEPKPNVHELAAMAMRGMMTNPECGRYDGNTVAAMAYRIADAMLAERARREKGVVIGVVAGEDVNAGDVVALNVAGCAVRLKQEK